MGTKDRHRTRSPSFGPLQSLQFAQVSPAGATPAISGRPEQSCEALRRLRLGDRWWQLATGARSSIKAGCDIARRVSRRHHYCVNGHHIVMYDRSVLTTLNRGLALLEALADGPRTARELAQKIDLPRQTAYRLAATLVSCGWVSLEPRTNTYALTRRAWSVATQADRSSDLVDAWHETVRSLAELGDTVHLAVYEAGEVLYVDKAEGSHPVRAYTQLGGRAPAHCVATGKVLLAFASPTERERVLGGPLLRPTERSIADPRHLESHLAQISEDGFAVNIGEWRPDVGGIAVPVRSCNGSVVAAIGYSAPIERITSRREELLAALRRAVARA